MGGAHPYGSSAVALGGSAAFLCGSTRGILPGQVSAGDWDAFVAKLIPPTAPNGPPSLGALDAVPAVAVTGQEVRLTASASDPDGDVLSYTWDFGDGASDTGSTTAGGGTITATHVYAAAGTYTVALTVTDGKGGSAGGSVAVSVSSKPNVAPSLSPISLSPTVAVAGNEVTVTSRTSDPDGDEVMWKIDWGDGASSSGSTMTGGGSIMAAHTYLTPGDYTLTLHVTDGEGGSTNETASVTVSAPPTHPSGGLDPLALWAIGGAVVAVATGAGFLIRRRNRTPRK